MATHTQTVRAPTASVRIATSSRPAQPSYRTARLAPRKYAAPALSSRSLSGRGTVGLAAKHNTARPTLRLGAVCGGGVEYMNAEELEVALQEREKPMIIDFFATWCGPCVLLAQELEKVAAELPDDVRIVKVDTDENPEISTQLQIAGLPTMIFVSTDRAKPALRTEGLLPADKIVDIIQNQL